MHKVSNNLCKLYERCLQVSGVIDRLVGKWEQHPVSHIYSTSRSIAPDTCKQHSYNLHKLLQTGQVN